MNAADRPKGTALSRLKVIATCFLAQNLVFGFSYGSFGPLVAANEAHFGVSRTAIAMGASVFNLALALLSPLIGGWLHKVPIRWAMVAGALLSATGYAGLAVLSNFTLALVMYALLGAGACILAVLGPVTIVSRWFTKTRARVLGTVNLPIFLLLTPIAIGMALPYVGRGPVLLTLAAGFLLVVPLLATLVERPPVAEPDAANPASARATDAQPLPTGAIVSSPAFWFLSIAIGIMAGASSTFIVHIVPFATGREMSLQSASSLVSMFAAMGIVGSLSFGWAVDRFGASLVLIGSALAQAVLWTAMLHASEPLLFVATALIGICLVPVNTLHGAAMAQVFPVASVSRALGLSYVIKLPFLFGFPPLAGWLFDRSGDYVLPFYVFSALALLACLAALAMLAAVRARRGQAVT